MRVAVEAVLHPQLRRPRDDLQQRLGVAELQERILTSTLGATFAARQGPAAAVGVNDFWVG